MTASAAELHLPIDIHVDIPGLAPTDQQLIRDVVQRCATDLGRDLDLPLQPQVTVTPSTGGKTVAGAEPERLIRIGGVTGRVRWWLPGDRVESGLPEATTLAGDLCEDLVANRVLFVTADGARLWQRRLTGPLAALSPTACLALMREAIALGVSLSRLEGAVATATGATMLDTPAIVDRAHETALSCTVQLSEHDFFEHTFAGLPEQWLDVLGLPVPLDVARAPDLGPGDFRLRANDLSLPVRNAAAWSHMFGRPANLDGRPLVAAVQRQLEEVAFLLATSGTVQLLRDLLRPRHPRLADEAGRIPEPDYCRAARHLLCERVPLTDLHGLTEAMLTTHGRSGVDDAEKIVFDPPSGVMLSVAANPALSLSPGELADVARISQGRVLDARFGPAHGTLSVTVLENSMETTIVRATLEERAALAPALVRAVAAAFLESRNHDAHPRILLCSGAARRLLHDMLATEFPDVCVLSYRELPVDAEIALASRARLS